MHLQKMIQIDCDLQNLKSIYSLLYRKYCIMLLNYSSLDEHVTVCYSSY